MNFNRDFLSLDTGNYFNQPRHKSRHFPNLLLPEIDHELILLSNRHGVVRNIVANNGGVTLSLRDAALEKNISDLLPRTLTLKIENILSPMPHNPRPDQITTFRYVENDQYYEIKITPHVDDQYLIFLRNITTAEQEKNELTLINRSLITLQSAALSISTSLDFQHVLNTFAWEIANFLQVEGCVVSKLSEENNQLQVLQAYPDSSWCRNSRHKNGFDLQEYPLTARVIRERYAQQTSLPPVDNLAEHSFMRAKDIQSILLLPLVYQSQSIGLVELLSRERRIFTEEEISLSQLLTGEAAGAIVNAQLYEQLEGRLQEISTINKTTKAIASSLDLKETLTVIVTSTLDLLEVEAVSIALLEETEPYLNFVAAAGKSAPLIRGKRMHRAKGLSGWVVTNGKPLIVQNVQQDSRHYGEFDQMIDFHTQGMLSVPLELQGKIIGVINAINKKNGEFGNEELRLLQSFSSSAATAIDHARLFAMSQLEIKRRREVERRLEREQASLQRRINEATQTVQRQFQRERAIAAIEPAISHPQELGKTLKTIVKAAESMLEADAGAIIILWDGTAHGYPQAMTSARVPRQELDIDAWLGSPFSQEIRRTQQFNIIEDVVQQRDQLQPELAVTGYSDDCWRAASRARFVLGDFVCLTFPAHSV
jgi:GAF domain-containing protein